MISLGVLWGRVSAIDVRGLNAHCIIVLAAVWGRVYLVYWILVGCCTHYCVLFGGCIGISSRGLLNCVLDGDCFSGGCWFGDVGSVYSPGCQFRCLRRI